MAFYFALFNVSNVNNELRGQRKAERKERDKRRHSLASSNCLSAAKDYRLLPRPQIVLHQPDEDDYPRVSLESINNRRSLSRDSVDRRGSNTSRTARMGSNADQLARELKKVHFRSIKRRRSKEKPNNNNAEEPIWMRRQTVDLSDSYPTDPQKRISDPWVYSIDLEENPPEAESKSRSQSLTHSESWSPESPISNSTNNTNTTLLSSPKQTWLASSETLTESSSQPSVNSEKVWHKPVMGVNALEDWDNEEVERTQEHLKDELQTHVNTWPEMNAKKKIRWRPTSLIRRHSESDEPRQRRTASEISSPSVEILKTEATTTPTNLPNQSTQYAGNNNHPPLISPAIPNVAPIVSRPAAVEVRPRPQILPAPVASTRNSRPLVITPIDSTMKKKIFRENLAALARQLGNKVNYRNYNENVPFINEFNDPRLSCDDVMTRSNIF